MTAWLWLMEHRAHTFALCTLCVLSAWAGAAPIVITEQKGLTLGNAVAGFAATLVIAPTDAGAAVFSASGDPNTPVIASIVEGSIVLTTGSGSGAGRQIVLDSWTFGGSLAADGTAVLDAQGKLSNMRVGATANIESDDIGGDYSASPTLRLLPN